MDVFTNLCWDLSKIKLVKQAPGMRIHKCRHRTATSIYLEDNIVRPSRVYNGGSYSRKTGSL